MMAWGLLQGFFRVRKTDRSTVDIPVSRPYTRQRFVLFRSPASFVEIEANLATGWALVKSIDDGLVDAGARLSGVEHLPVRTASAALHARHAHARIIVPVLSLTAHRVHVQALLVASVVALEIFSWNRHARASLWIEIHRRNAYAVAYATARVEVCRKVRRAFNGAGDFG